MLKITKKCLDGHVEKYSICGSKLNVVGFDPSLRIITFMTSSGNVQGALDDAYEYEEIVDDMKDRGDVRIVIHEPAKPIAPEVVAEPTQE